MKRMLLLSIFMVIMLGLVGCGAKTMTWQEQYDLGMRYLTEDSYEEAIIAFTVAIEIEPNRAEAYIGRGDAYVSNAEQASDQSIAVEQYEKALADYEIAAELGDVGIDEKLKEVREICKRLQVSLQAQNLLKPLYDYFVAGDLENAKTLMRQDDYRALSAATVDAYLYYDDSGENGLAVYPDNYYYFGQWRDGVRSGNGMWIRAAYESDKSDESYIYEGEWANDMPNGVGKILENRYLEKIQIEAGETIPVKIETEGSFTDGIQHGTINETWLMNDGSLIAWTPITAVNGIYQKISSTHGGGAIPENQIHVANCKQGSAALYSSNNSVEAVKGFEP